MDERYRELTARLKKAVLAGPGVTEPALRQAVHDYAAHPGDIVPPEVPPALHEYVRKVARQAHTVTDEDMAALRQAGVSQDTLYEITVAAALGAGLGRLQRGLAALEGEI